jgi:DNA primase
MQIEFDAFLDWANKRFSNVLIKGNEIRLNSVFAEDKGHHLWCNPSGGKKGVVFGVYHCFKTDKKGTLVNLVMDVEKCDFYTALRVLRGSARVTSKELVEILDLPEKNINNKKNEIKLPEYCEKINKFSNRKIHLTAIDYLDKRKIDFNDFYVCYDGSYNNRIIIPYFDFQKRLIYFNSRALHETRLRYLGPPKTIGVGKEDVLYFPEIPKDKKIYLTEGEFDAYSLFLSGLSSAACGGKNLSDIQASVLSKFNICLCLDLDKAGTAALKSMKTKLDAFNSSSEKNRITIIRPAEGYKDWNEMLIKFNKDVIKSYVEKFERPFDLNSLGDLNEL